VAVSTPGQPPSERLPRTFVVTHFSEVQRPADQFRSGEGVIVRLECDRDTTRRVVDFLSGLTYGADGRMERVAKNTFLVTPADYPDHLLPRKG
jgi:FtsZ-interacting cell division protein YlmF